MAASVFGAARVALFAVRTIAFCSLIVLITSLTMTKPVRAAGTISPAITSVSYNSGWYGLGSIHCSNYSTEAEVLACFHQQWDSYVGDSRCAPYCYALCSAPVNLGNGYFSVNTWGYYAGGCKPGYIDNNYRFAYLYSCPAYSKATPAANPASCTCDDNYVPDATGTNCVLVNNCPANMSGTPCACNPGGYVLNPDGAGCIEEQYTITEPQNQTQLPDVEPSSSGEIATRVTSVQTGQPKEGAEVRFHLDVDLTSGGHDHGESLARRSRGSISSSNCVAESGGAPDTYDCTTGPDGYTGFTFKAPAVSGMHTIAATCISPHCNGSVTGGIKVKVEGLEEIPETAAWVLIKKPGPTHKSGHYLNSDAMMNLRLLAGNYTLNHPLQYLHLNDASLEWGGRFDINGEWTPPHGKHRRGVVIDVRANDDTGATGAIPLSFFANFITMAASIKRGIDGRGIEAQVHCTSNFADGQNRLPPACLGSDGSQDSNRHFHILLLGVDQ